MPEVSVIIPSYNHAEFIAETIRSLLGQDFQDFEIIVVDDGSRDDTVAVLKSFADPRLKLIEFAENQGASVAGNHAISMAAGRYLAFCNSDDLFLPHKLSAQVAFLRANSTIGAVFSLAGIIDETGNDFSDESHFYYRIFDQKNRSRHQWLNHFFFYGNCLCHPSAMLRRECFNQVGFFDERLAQLTDLDYWIRLCMVSEIHILPERLVKFRIRSCEKNASGQNIGNILRSPIEQFHILKNYLNISAEDFTAIFPAGGGMNQLMETPLVPYLLAQEALKVNNPAYRMFAVDTLNAMLADKVKVAKLRSRMNFSFRDYHRLSGTLDVFNQTQGWDSHLFVDVGQGFNDREMLTQKVNPNVKNFEITFDLSGFEPIKALRWDPSEGKWCRLRIDSILLYDGARFSEIEKERITANGTALDDGEILFQTFDPMIIFPVDASVSGVVIKGQWQFVSIQDIDRQVSEMVAKKDQVTNLINRVRRRVGCGRCQK